MVGGTPTVTNNYVYDANGSLIAKTNLSSSSYTNLYGYDLKNKLSYVTSAGSSTTNRFQYNDQGIRVRTVDGSTATYYLVDANNHTDYAQMLEEFSVSGGTPTLTRSYVLGDDVLGQCGTTTSDPRWLLYDGHGSTRQVGNAAGTAVTCRYNYEAYGEKLTTTSTSAQNTDLLYCGEQYDSTLKMYNLRARYYDPKNGRFNAMDSFGGDNFDPQSLHKYAYTGCDPLNGTDPTGRFTLVELGVAMLIGTAIGMWGAIIANHALGRAQTYSSILTGGAFGAVLGPASVAVPAIGVGAGLWGIYGSGSVAWEVFHNPNATAVQKAEAVALVVASIWGTRVAIKYARRVGTTPPEELVDVAAPEVPEFPLELEAPEGVVLESMQDRLDSGKISQLPELIEDMVAGKEIGDVPAEANLPASARTKIPPIGGYKDGGRYIINEGNHRMAAALEFFKATGDAKYVFKFLETGKWDPLPKQGVKTYKLTKS